MTKQVLTRPDSSEYAPYYGRYISLVPDGDIAVMLIRQLETTQSVLKGISESRADTSYAPGKWTIKEVVGHLTDSERIFAYRALRIARNDQTPLAGFEQDDFIRYSGFRDRTLIDLAEEFDYVRRSNVYLFKSFSNEAWDRRGVASDAHVSVRALAYIITGHELHHLNVLREKYL